MATNVIDNNEARVPFFGDRVSFITGLDPLGLQNPSIQAYSLLLPGLNNVTSRIRSYSFYCWLLSEYPKQNKQLEGKEQKKFIRRAEYIIALIASHNKIAAISGIAYAEKVLNETTNKIDLQTGTYNEDGSTTNTYWQYSFGVFGQYYLGSLRQIGLLEEPINEKGEFIGVYRQSSKSLGIKVSGDDLATAFDKNVEIENKLLFFDCIKKGSITLQNLEQLSNDFNLKEVKKTNFENQLLLDLLFDKDEPLIHKELLLEMRKKTLFYLLSFTKLKGALNNQFDFTSYVYQNKGIIDNKQNDCLTGWYYYQLNDYWQLACTAIFNGSLDFILKQNGYGWMNLNSFFQTCKKAIVEKLIQEKFIETDQITVTEFLKADVFNIDEVDLYKEIIKSKIERRMAFGIVLILKLFIRNYENTKELQLYTSKYDIGYDDVLSYYTKFDKYKELTISDFILQFINTRIIYRHQFVAYRKMGTSNQSTHKFMIEESSIRVIGNFDPFFTSPRIRSVINYFQDLGLLDEKNQLSNDGRNLIKTLNI
jgi:hypothetical protein